MENKVKNIHQARAIFDLLGIKDVTKDFQSKRGDQVFELPFKTMYANGYKEVNRFTIYKSGYVRKMLVNSKGASWCCYQLNRTRGVEEYHKDYEWSTKNDAVHGDYGKLVWTGKYRKSNRKERIMIPNHEDRYIYLCNYILKNYYRNQKGASFYRVSDYQVKLMDMHHSHYWENQRKDDQLPFVDNAVNRILKDSIDEDDKFFSSTDDVQVIINGHRYNLS